ncbi:MAG TPA: CAP domain-containing protein [Mycobacterium sp.]|nr:CAP domain-containing protein [Mycobacterium sp.]
MTAFGSVLAAVPAQAGGDQGAAVLNQINATRAANGCGPVAANPQLTASAARQAGDMLENGVQGHTGSDGSSLAQRVANAGYGSYTKLGEIVFSSTGPGNTPTAAVTWWMNSPGHRAIITDCELTDAGFSAVSSGDKTTVAGDFGKK